VLVDALARESVLALSVGALSVGLVALAACSGQGSTIGPGGAGGAALDGGADGNGNGDAAQALDAEWEDAGGAGGDAGGGGARDAEGGPAGITPISPGYVYCGPSTPPCDTTSATSMCCGLVDSNGVRGQCVAQGSDCPTITGPGGNVFAKCDGPEDCPAGQVCSGDYGANYFAPSCATSSTTPICHDHTQCGASQPLCCPVIISVYQSNVTLPYGVCSTSAPLGIRCDGN
jgi:hypothetical protein